VSLSLHWLLLSQISTRRLNYSALYWLQLQGIRAKFQRALHSYIYVKSVETPTEPYFRRLYAKYVQICTDPYIRNVYAISHKYLQGITLVVFMLNTKKCSQILTQVSLS
jgi:hypothetical protein